MENTKPDKTTRPAHGREHIKQRHPRIIVLIACLVAAVVAMALLKLCVDGYRNTSNVDNIAKSGGDTLDVAIEMSPLSYALSGDSVSGLDYEMLRDMSASLGRPVKFHPFAPLDWAMLGLRKGKFDMVVGSLQATEPMRQHVNDVLLTDNVYSDRQVLVQRKDAQPFVSDAHRLAGDTVWLSKGSPVITRLRNLMAEIGDTIYVKNTHTYTSEQLSELVAAGKIDRAVVCEGVARSVAARDNRLDVSTPVSFSLLHTWALAPGDTATLSAVNRWLAAYRTTPRYKALTTRYLDR